MVFFLCIPERFLTWKATVLQLFLTRLKHICLYIQHTNTIFNVSSPFAFLLCQKREGQCHGNDEISTKQSSRQRPIFFPGVSRMPCVYFNAQLAWPPTLFTDGSSSARRIGCTNISVDEPRYMIVRNQCVPRHVPSLWLFSYQIIWNLLILIDICIFSFFDRSTVISSSVRD